MQTVPRLELSDIPKAEMYRCLLHRDLDRNPTVGNLKNLVGIYHRNMRTQVGMFLFFLAEFWIPFLGVLILIRHPGAQGCNCHMGPLGSFEVWGGPPIDGAPLQPIILFKLSAGIVSIES